MARLPPPPGLIAVSSSSNLTSPNNPQLPSLNTSNPLSPLAPRPSPLLFPQPNRSQSKKKEMEGGKSLKSAALLEQMKLHLATDAGKEITKKIGLVYQLNIAPKKLGVDEEIYVVDLKEGQVTQGPYKGKPDATFSFTDKDFLAVATGKMNPQMAFIRGAMKIKGSLSAAQKFTPEIFPKPSKL